MNYLLLPDCPRTTSLSGFTPARLGVARAINCGYDLLEAKCNRCDRVLLVPLRGLKHPPDTPVWKLEAALYAARAGTTAGGSGRIFLD